jgi:hypothetical protein
MNVKKQLGKLIYLYEMKCQGIFLDRYDGENWILVSRSEPNLDSDLATWRTSDSKNPSSCTVTDLTRAKCQLYTKLLDQQFTFSSSDDYVTYIESLKGI